MQTLKLLSKPRLSIRFFSALTGLFLISAHTLAYADPVLDAINRQVGGYGQNVWLSGGTSSADPNVWAYPLGWNSGDFAALATGQGLVLSTPAYQTGPIPTSTTPSRSVRRPDVAVNPAPTPTGQAIINAFLQTDSSAVFNYTHQNIPAPSLSSSSAAFGSAPSGPSVSMSSVANFDANSLLGPSVYADNNAMVAADNYIQFVSGLVSPPLMGSQITAMQNSTSFQAYMSLLYTYVSGMSVGVANLYHLYADRVPVSASSSNPAQGALSGLNSLGIGAVAQLPSSSPGYPQASALEVDQYSATRRFTDPAWRQGVQEASPTVLAREQLYLLAEIRYELFLSRMELQRLLASSSAMQLQNLNFLTQTSYSQLKYSATTASVSSGGGAPVALP